MNKIVAFACASGIGWVSIGALIGTTQNFDYANASEERQQKHLDKIAKGFETGFNLTSRGKAEIEHLRADARLDMIAVTVRYKDAKIERASAFYLEKFTAVTARNSCDLANKLRLLSTDATMRIRMKRPSGAPFGVIDLNERACARFG